VSGDHSSGNVPIDPKSYKTGKDEAAVLGRDTLYRTGYRFAGWIDNAGKSYQAGDKIPVNRNLSLRAKWERVFPLIAAGDDYSVIVTESGSVYAVGSNDEGRNGTGGKATTFTKVNIPGKVVNVFAGGKNCFVVLEDGTMYAWGHGEYGKLGNDQDKGSLSPVLLKRIDGVHFISPGSLHTGLLTDTGDYWAAGRRNFGALGAGSNSGSEKKFLKITENVVSAAVGSNYTMVVKKDGTLLTSGAGDSGGQGTGSSTVVSKLTQNLKEGANNAQVFTGYMHTLLLKKDGRLMAAGYNNSGQTSNEEKAMNTQLAFQAMVDETGQNITGVSDVSLGRDFTMILKNEGTLWGVGSNAQNKLGYFPPSSVASVTNAVKVMDNVAYVAAGINHTLAVTEDGSVWAAGSNSINQYGDKFIPSTEKAKWKKLDLSGLN
jgi:uncharacterized repeat protein (TIGR02543 family)